MLELLKFALDSPTNFFGTITLICLFYALFGGSSLNAFRDFLDYRKGTAELRVKEAEAVRDQFLAKDGLLDYPKK